MRKLVFTLLSLSLLCSYSCDDGDVITFELDFDETFSACEGVTSLVFYKTKNDPSESLSIVIKDLTLEQILTVEDNGSLEIVKPNSDFNYRTYSNETLPSNLFCNDIPLADIIITQDDVSLTTATINTVLTEDDEDGIPAELEDINGNGDLTDDDTDGDGLPNYIDADDDGDNVLTKDEDPNPNGDGILDDALDTDGDGIPNYLDPDDDGDNIDTRDEETDSPDQNPGNDVTNSDIGADYLNKDVANADTPVATAYRNHTIKRTYTVTIKLTDIDLTLISIDELDFGLLEDGAINSNLKSRTITPDFN